MDQTTTDDVRDLYAFVQTVVEDRGWHSADSEHAKEEGLFSFVIRKFQRHKYFFFVKKIHFFKYSNRKS